MVSLKAWQIEEKSEFGTFGFQTQVNSSKQLAKIYDTGYFLKYVLTHIK